MLLGEGARFMKAFSHKVCVCICVCVCVCVCVFVCVYFGGVGFWNPLSGIDGTI